MENVTERVKISNNTNLEEAAKYCPLNISVIPNEMGINLCSVKSVEWSRQDDGQLVWLKINFMPEPKE